MKHLLANARGFVDDCHPHVGRSITEFWKVVVAIDLKNIVEQKLHFVYRGSIRGHTSSFAARSASHSINEIGNQPERLFNHSQISATERIACHPSPESKLSPIH
jgi:hypothetical protein